MMLLADKSAVRNAVGRWLRTRMSDPGKDNQRGPLRAAIYTLGQTGDFDKAVAAMYQQLAADAEHSALLWRLLEGKEPLPEPPQLVNSYPDYGDQ